MSAVKTGLKARRMQALLAKKREVIDSGQTKETRVTRCQRLRLQRRMIHMNPLRDVFWEQIRFRVRSHLLGQYRPLLWFEPKERQRTKINSLLWRTED